MNDRVLLDIGMKMINFDQVEFDTSNPEPRCPCVLLLDTSGSMEGERIRLLNQGLRTFKTELEKDSLAAKRVEIAIITFGGKVDVVQDFISPSELHPPVLCAEGQTPMGEAVTVAIDCLQLRKKIYKENGISYYRPWIFLITDGEPTDGDLWEKAAKVIALGEKEKKLACFTVAIDENANLEVLQSLSPRKPLPLKGLEFSEMFVWLSSSLSNVSRSRTGDATVALPPPSGWAEL